MFNWNDLKNLDVKGIDVTKLDLTRFDVRKLDLRKLELPELPVDADRIFGLARDAAYAGIGVAVVGVHKLDAQRRQLTDQLTDQVTAQMRKVVDGFA